MGPIEGETVSMSLLFTLQSPQDEAVGVDDRELLKGGIGEALILEAGMEKVNQMGVLIELALELFGAVAQLGADGMLAQTLPDDVVIGSEEVIAEVSEEMKMANKIRNRGEDRGHGFEDAWSHVMNQRQRDAEVGFDVLQKGNDFGLLFRGQLEISQHDFGKGIQTAHEHRAAGLASGIQVEDISTLQAHVGLDSGGALLMRKRQISNESSPQKRDLTGTDFNVTIGQFLDHFPLIAMAQKKRPTDPDQDVVAEVGAGRDQCVKLLRTVGALTTRANQHGVAGVEFADVQGQDRASLGFENFETALTAAAVGVVRSEVDPGWMGKQRYS